MYHVTFGLLIFIVSAKGKEFCIVGIEKSHFINERAKPLDKIHEAPLCAIFAGFPPAEIYRRGLNSLV
jgi:hypothetical protein